MRLSGDLGFLPPRFAVVIFLVVFPALLFILRRKWRIVTAKRDDSNRRRFVASEEIESKSEIVVEDFVRYSVNFAASSNKYCAVCYTPTHNRCARCKAVHYCSGKCQIIHWRRGHKDECHPPQTNFEDNEETVSPVINSVDQPSESITDIKIGKVPLTEQGDTTPEEPRFSSEFSVREDNDKIDGSSNVNEADSPGEIDESSFHDDVCIADSSDDESLHDVTSNSFDNRESSDKNLEESNALKDGSLTEVESGSNTCQTEDVIKDSSELRSSSSDKSAEPKVSTSDFWDGALDSYGTINYSLTSNRTTKSGESDDEEFSVSKSSLQHSSLSDDSPSDLRLLGTKASRVTFAGSSRVNEVVEPMLQDKKSTDTTRQENSTSLSPKRSDVVLSGTLMKSEKETSKDNGSLSRGLNVTNSLVVEERGSSPLPLSKKDGMSPKIPADLSSSGAKDCTIRSMEAMAPQVANSTADAPTVRSTKASGNAVRAPEVNNSTAGAPTVRSTKASGNAVIASQVTNSTAGAPTTISTKASNVVMASQVTNSTAGASTVRSTNASGNAVMASQVTNSTPGAPTAKSTNASGNAVMPLQVTNSTSAPTVRFRKASGNGSMAQVTNSKASAAIVRSKKSSGNAVMGFQVTNPTASATVGLKTSVLKVVEQLRASRSSKQNEAADKSHDKGVFPYELFVKLYHWNKVELRPCGLINCGNSCYANAVLQCLAFTPPLTAYFLQGLHSKACATKEWCFACEFERLMLKAREGISSQSPIGILSQIQKIGSHLAAGREEDAHEFLRYAIDTMQSICLREAGLSVSSSLEEETNLMGLTFGGYLRSKIKCTRCHGKSERHERMMDLTVEIDGDIETLEDALRQFTGTESLDGDNKYHCSRCKSYEKARKKLNIIEAPNVLTIALKRFQSGKFGKLNKQVRFPEILNLAPYMRGTSDKSPIYRLYGVVVHLDIMNAAFSGHYVCYVRNAHNKWYKIDDSMVKSVERDTVLNKGAYMLFYSRCSPRAPRSIRSSIVSHNLSSKKNTELDPTHNTRKNHSSSRPNLSHAPQAPERLSPPNIFEESSSETSSLWSNSDEISSSTDSNKDDSITATDDDISDYTFSNSNNGFWSHSSDSEGASTSSSSSSSPLYTNPSLPHQNRYSATHSEMGSARSVPFLQSNGSSKQVRNLANSCSCSCRKAETERFGWSNVNSGVHLRRSLSKTTDQGFHHTVLS